MSRWFLGPTSWKDLEAVLSDRPVQGLSATLLALDRTENHLDENTSREHSSTGAERKEADAAHAAAPAGPAYAELHAHSHFSFLDGASSPADMVQQAQHLGLQALALVDHDGLPGAVQFATAAREAGIATIFGAELTLGTEPGALTATDTLITSAARTRSHDPEGEHLLILARDDTGYRQLSAAIARAHLDSRTPGTPRYRLADLSAQAQEGHWQILTGCRKGAVTRAVMPRLEAGDLEGAAEAAATQIQRLLDLFGVGNVAVELIVGDGPSGDELHDALVQGARLVRERSTLSATQLPILATTGAHYAHPRDRRLADVHAALRAGVCLDDADPYLPSRSAHLRSGSEMLALLPRYPQAISEAARLGSQCALDLRLLAPDLPPFPVPPGHDETTWLRALVEKEAQERYGPRTQERVPGAWAQIDRELQVISDLHFPGYFLIVHDIVAFCAERKILCQGRGSAANSAVCYALGITAVEPVGHHLLFERFLAPERDGPPDIDIDIASDRREEVIQYVYERYGRENAAQVANVITYRARLAVRDAARALGYDVGSQDAFARRIERSFSTLDQADLPPAVADLARRLRGTPRHLGIHSGGMVLCDRPVIDVCPVQWARAEGRTVLQWDKDDCAEAGLVKFDLLGLGMLTALDHCLALVAEHHGQRFELRTLPQEDPAVYDMLSAGDSIGVFQVESRAQISTLPRLKPRCFYDLVVQVALIRPGPLQGGSVHPYIRRRNGEEPVTFLHPRLESSLGRTLGVPLFQEQLMQMVVDIADFSPAQADQLRRAMGSKRSTAKMLALSEALFTGMARNGITGEAAQAVHRKLLAFANYGFPESHAYSFAYLVYASAYLKCHYPAAFTAALLRAQPMGFYSPQSLVADARRHGVHIRGPHVQASAARTDLETDDEHHGYQVPQALRSSVLGAEGYGKRAPGEERPRDSTPGEQAGGEQAARKQADDDEVCGKQPHGGRACGKQTDGEQAPGGHEPEHHATPPQVKGEAAARGPAIRLGLDQVRGISTALAQRIVAAREADGPFASIPDLARRVRLDAAQLEALATAGALDSLATSRREALWAAGAAAQESPDRLPGLCVGTRAPMLPGMSDIELAQADGWATGITLADHPMALIREQMNTTGVLSAREAREARHGSRIRVGGVITHRQRPSTAGGITFLSLEDETGILNVVCSPGFWRHNRALLRGSRAVVLRGIVENDTGAVNLVADAVRPLLVPAAGRSRDFQ